jgi:hypothetical protein
MKVEQGNAYFSDDRTYRYALSRVWDVHKPMLGFIGLNPSTADENKLDPTLRRIVRFAMRENCGGFWMFNLFAFRATVPRVMLLAHDPVGPDNDRWLMDGIRWCEFMVCGWGAHGGHRGRDMEVRKLFKGHKLWCLGLTKDGQPKHPLYLPKDTPLVEYQSSLWRPEPVIA